MVSGAAAGVLTASGLVVGFAPELGTHGLERPPTVRAVVTSSAEPSVPVTTPTQTPSPTPSPQAPRTDEDESRTADAASRSEPRSEAPDVPAVTAPSPTAAATKAPHRQGTPAPQSTRKPGRDDDTGSSDLVGGLMGVPLVP